MPIPDLLKYASDVVNHKTVWQRIGHSPALHTARSVISSKTSLASKAINFAGVLGRGGLTLIPIPVVGSLLATAEKHVEEKIRKRRNKNRAEAAKPIGEKVKFELKELSLEEVDRYRWKVQQSMTALNAAIQKWQDIRQKAEDDHALCAAYVELATAAEQASRRIEKLHDKCSAVAAVMKETMDWLEQLFGDIDTPQSVCGTEYWIKQRLEDEIRAVDTLLSTSGEAEKVEARKFYIEEHHSKCTGWCWAKDVSAPPIYSYPRTVEWSAKVLKWAAEPFTLDSLGSFSEIGKSELGEKG